MSGPVQSPYDSDQSTVDDDESLTNSDTDWSEDNEDSGSDDESSLGVDMGKLSIADSPSGGAPAAAAPSVATSSAPGQIFATPEMQAGVHKMLTHLQEWWEHSEMLLQLMASKNLPCKSIERMSDQIDKMLDKSIEKLIKNVSADPSVFPIAALVKWTREIKLNLFLKVGEVCCQSANQDECAKAANVALVALKKFRNSANEFYDQMIAHVITAMDATEGGADDIDTPEIEALLQQLMGSGQAAGKGSKPAGKVKAPSMGKAPGMAAATGGA